MDLYAFAMRGLLTDAALDKAGRSRRHVDGQVDIQKLEQGLAYDMLDQDLLVSAKNMSVVYAAIHAFENMVRHLVASTLEEEHKESWWDKVPERIQRKVRTRKEEEAKFRWHGERGGEDIGYCDFGDLSSIMVTNQGDFVDVVPDMEWAKAILSTLEKSRNIIMHGGILGDQDIHRIGMHIRDWVRQSG